MDFLKEAAMWVLCAPVAAYILWVVDRASRIFK